MIEAIADELEISRKGFVLSVIFGAALGGAVVGGIAELSKPHDRIVDPSSFRLDANALIEYMKQDGTLDVQRLQREAVNAAGMVTITGLDLTKRQKTVEKELVVQGTDGENEIVTATGQAFAAKSHTDLIVNFPAFDFGYAPGSDSTQPILAGDKYTDTAVTFRIRDSIADGSVISGVPPYLSIEGLSHVPTSAASFSRAQVRRTVTNIFRTS